MRANGLEWRVALMVSARMRLVELVRLVELMRLMRMLHLARRTPRACFFWSAADTLTRGMFHAGLTNAL